MRVTPETNYVERGGMHIAYQVIGEGPRDVVFMWGPYSHVEVAWEHPACAHYLSRLASFSRLIHLDKRGTGLSDHSARLATYEEQIDDVLAVLDALRSERATLLGGGHAALLAILFAAAHPDRTSALILSGAQARELRDDDYPWGPTSGEWEALVGDVSAAWGTGLTGLVATPTATDDATRRWWGKLERYALNRGEVEPTFRMVGETDVRAVLSTIQVPTLALHRTLDPLIEVGKGRYVADHIPGARFVELAGYAHAGWGEGADAELDEIQLFLTGVRPAEVSDRVLATVLFTDIIDSTSHVSRLGDYRWREVLDAHDTEVSTQVSRHRGRLVKTTGDGALAVFDGPVRAIQCALAICEHVQMLGIEVRAGLHTGEIEQRGDDIGGIAVHLAERIERLAGPGEVLVTRVVRDLTGGSGIMFDGRGVHQLKGMPDDCEVFAVAEM